MAELSAIIDSSDVDMEIQNAACRDANGAIRRVTSTNNAVVRFDGTTGEVQDSPVKVLDNADIEASSEDQYHPQIRVESVGNYISAGYVNFRAARGSLAAKSPVQGNDVLGTFIGQGMTSSSGYQNAAWFAFRVDGTPTANNVPGRIEFSTYHSSSNGRKMVILSNGNVAIGDSGIHPYNRLEVDGAMALRAMTAPADPTVQAVVLYQDSASNDLMAKLSDGTTTKVATIVDYSTL